MDEREQQNITDQEQRIELSKSKSTLVRSWLVDTILVLIIIALGMLIWYLWSGRNSSNVVGAMSAEAKDTIRELHDTLATANAQLGAVDAKEINARIKDLGDNQRGLTRALNTLDNKIDQIGTAAAKDLDTARQNLLSLKGVTDEARTQLRDFSMSARRIIDNAEPNVTEVTANLKELSGSLSDSAKALKKASEDPKVKEFIDFAIAHGRSIIGNFDTTSGTLSLMSEDGKQITAHLKGITDNFEGMTQDSRKKLHEVLWPPPAHGVWGHTKQALTFLIRPIGEGFRIYESLTSLPVRITQPVPLLAPKQ